MSISSRIDKKAHEWIAAHSMTLTNDAYDMAILNDEAFNTPTKPRIRNRIKTILEKTLDVKVTLAPHSIIITRGASAKDWIATYAGYFKNLRDRLLVIEAPKTEKARQDVVRILREQYSLTGIVDGDNIIIYGAEETESDGEHRE